MRSRPRPPALLALALLAACAKAERIELSPTSVRFVGLGKTTQVQARPFERNGKHIPDPPCAWSSSDQRVVKVAARGNEAVLTGSGPGSAVVRCSVGGASAELPVQVRVVSRLSVRPERAELKVTDAPAPLALSVEAFDEQGAPLPGRAAMVACQREEVCRGDSRGQLWPVGPGETTARVELEGASATVPVKVVEGRTALGRPRPVKGNPMEEIERAVQERDKAERAQRGREAR